MTPHGEPPGGAPCSTPRAPASGYALLLLITAVLFVLRLSGPPNLTDNDQERPASYVLDAVANGHWIVQRDWLGDWTSKPPLYTWCAAVLSVLVGQVNLLTLYLPCALAMFGSAALVYRESTRVLGSHAGFLAGVFVLANPLSAKLVALARTDAMFTFTVTLTAVLVFRAWRNGRGWIGAWIAAGLATLTKGPFGWVLGFSGTLAALGERRSNPGRFRPATHLAGLAVLLILSGGWFYLAWRVAGDPLVAKMLKAELVSHAMGGDDRAPRSWGLVLAPTYFLTRFAPWSLLSLAGLWRVFARPNPVTDARCWERFVALWLATGILLLGLASHQRGDLVAPLIPAGAVLAAALVAPMAQRWPMRRLAWTATILALLMGAGFQLQHAGRKLRAFEESRAVSDLAKTFLQAGGNPRELIHTDTPYALQFHLGTMIPTVSIAEAADRLQRGEARWVAVSDGASLERALPAVASRLRSVATWAPEGQPLIQIVFLENAPGPAETREAPVTTESAL